MTRSLLALGRLAATIALVATMAVGFASVARADDWARDHVATQAFASLDPAIRTAINGRNLDAAPPAAVSTPVGDEGFAWGAAALGVGTGVAAMCAVLA